MATITGNVFNLKKSAAANSTLRFTYASAPATANGGLVASGVTVTAAVSITGTFSVVLTMGDYYVTIESAKDNPEDLFTISVPDNDTSYDILARIVSSVTQSPTVPVGGSTPNATSTVIGAVKLSKNTSAGVGVVTPGVYFVADVAALKALTTDILGHTFAVLTTPNAGEPPFFYWNSASTAADDPVGFTVVKPTDNPATGRWFDYGFGVPLTFETKAEARACPSVRLRSAGSATIWGGVAADDGYGGIYRFKLGGSEADDDAQYLRPDDYSGAGANQGTLVKLL